MLSINAQDDRPVRIGISAMPASSWFSTDSEGITSESAGFGFSYGLLVDLAIGQTSNYAFSTGVLINSHGGTITNTRYHDGRTIMVDGREEIYPDFGVVNEKYRLQYLDIPLVLKLKTNEIGYMTYYGQFGLDLSVNIDVKKDVEGAWADGEPISIEDEPNANDDINLLRGALQVGGGAEFNISGNTYLMAGIVWNNGLSDVFAKEAVNTDTNGRPVAGENNVIERDGNFKASTNYLGLQLAIFF